MKKLLLLVIVCMLPFVSATEITTQVNLTILVDSSGCALNIYSEGSSRLYNCTQNITSSYNTTFSRDVNNSMNYTYTVIYNYTNPYFEGITQQYSTMLNYINDTNQYLTCCIDEKAAHERMIENTKLCQDQVTNLKSEKDSYRTYFDKYTDCSAQFSGCNQERMYIRTELNNLTGQYEDYKKSSGSSGFMWLGAGALLVYFLFVYKKTPKIPEASSAPGPP